MAVVTIAVVSELFGRDLAACFRKIARHIEAARAQGVQLLALPEAALGGYLEALAPPQPLRPPGPPSPPGAGTADDLGLLGPAPLLEADGPEIARLVELAGDMIVCVGYTERHGARRYNSAVCVGRGKVLGRHRKVHLPLTERASYDVGSGF